jgi:hypothetical protein
MAVQYFAAGTATTLDVYELLQNGIGTDSGSFPAPIPT